MYLVIKGFRTIVFIFIVISTTFRQICPPTFFRCLSNSGTFTELRTTSFIKSTGVVCSDSVSHNRVQVLSIPVLLLSCSEDWTCNDCLLRSLGNQRHVSYRTIQSESLGLINLMFLLDLDYRYFLPVLIFRFFFSTNTWRRTEDISAETLWK